MSGVGVALDDHEQVSPGGLSAGAGGWQRSCEFFAPLDVYVQFVFSEMSSSTSVSLINVRLAFNTVQVLLNSPSPTVHQLKRHIAPTFSSTPDQLRVVRMGTILKDSAVLADGEIVAALCTCIGGSACMETALSLHTPVSCSHVDFSESDDEADPGSPDLLSVHIASMKTLRRLQSSAPKSSSKLFSNRSNLLSSDYADIVLGFTPPKLTAKAAKVSCASRQEQAASEFQDDLAPEQHRGVVECAAGKNFQVRSLLDNRVRNCRIKGLLKRHIQVNSVVVFEPSVKFGDDDHGDILWRYFDKEIELLQLKGLLPEASVLWPKPAVALIARCRPTASAASLRKARQVKAA
jgi:translation initiation factor IF-1